VDDWLSSLTPEESTNILLSSEPLAMPPLQYLIINMTSYSVWKSNQDLSRARLGFLGAEIPYDVKARGHLIRYVHKNLMYYLHFVDANKISVKAAYNAAQKLSTGSVSSASCESFMEDLDYYRSELVTAISRAEEFASSVAFEVTLREGEYSGMISRLAFLLAPVATVAAVLAIPGPDSRLIIFGTVSTAYILAIGLLMVLWAPLGLSERLKTTSAAVKTWVTGRLGPRSASMTQEENLTLLYPHAVNLKIKTKGKYV
jgi:hypothetical protein